MKYLVGLCFLTCSVVPSFGTTISFATPTGDRGVTQTYGGLLATAYGTGSPHLYGKNDGGDENGVGLTSDSSGDHEITSGGFIQLDVSSLTGSGPISITFIMNSSTSPDAWRVFESNSALAMSGSATVNGTDEGMHTIVLAQGENFLDFTATGGNVLLSSISYTLTPTPEPISLALTGSGLLGLFLLRRRQKGSRNTDSRL
jgi:hypothetical protein